MTAYRGGARGDWQSRLFDDRCCRDTALVRLAATPPCPVGWHPGFRLGVEEPRRHPDYRGAEIVEPGAALAGRRRARSRGARRRGRHRQVRPAGLAAARPVRRAGLSRPVRSTGTGGVAWLGCEP
ncbi:hypothetical protein [Actinocatenispora comari]|uniref:hypothetical protein n=1 Tax=Actinocatenispora comari TaxID=2807577 RepID=UPI001CEDCBC5|nr:hypothetical protein [Actinocatenispora comari]